MSEFYGDSPSPPDDIHYVIKNKKVCLQDVLKIISNMADEYDKNIHVEESFDKFIKNSISKNKCEEYLNILSSCECCEKHKKKRPKNLEDNPDYSIFKIGIYKEPSCYCKCRHYSRWLFRAYSEQNYF